MLPLYTGIATLVNKECEDWHKSHDAQMLGSLVLRWVGSLRGALRHIDLCYMTPCSLFFLSFTTLFYVNM